MKVYLYEKEYESSVNRKETVPIIVDVPLGTYILLKNNKVSSLVIEQPEIEINFDDGIYIE